MKKGSVLKTILGTWNTKTVVVIAIGAALFGVLMNFGSIPIFTNTKLTTAMIVPVIVGALYGPVPAFVACLVGNTIADLIGGWGFWFDWAIGNGVLGFIIGLLPLYGAKIAEGVFKVTHAIIFSIVCVLGNILAFGIITPLFTTAFYGGEIEITLVQSLVGSISNIVVLIVIGIPILILLAKRNARSNNLKIDEKEE